MAHLMIKKTERVVAHKSSQLRVGLVVPHIFMQQSVLPQVIFAPGKLALDLAEGLIKQDVIVTLFTPGPVDTVVKNITSDLSSFNQELAERHDSYINLLKKHPLTFISLARQVQSELIAKAFAMANDNQLDVVHIYTNEEDVALPFAQFCKKPVVFTHHDPFNFLVTYKSVFPKYPALNWVSISFAQRQGMPSSTNWIGNVYHGLTEDLYKPEYNPKGHYLVYIGRIIEPKGLHLAIQAVQIYNQSHKQPYKLKIVGKHYAGYHKDAYWQKKIAPKLTDPNIEYEGFISDTASKQAILSKADAVLVPSIFAEPFGMVAIESLACATPVICLNSGALPEIIKNKLNGIVVKRSLKNKQLNADKAVADFIIGIEQASKIDRHNCRQSFEEKFTAKRMCAEYETIYQKLSQSSKE